MCVAGLNISTQACAHRWYELIQPCNPATNLHNCPERLRLQGWERRQASCPFCKGSSHHHHSTHRLFGSSSSAASSSYASSIASSPGRRGSGATLSREPSTTTSIEWERATKAKDMNDRIRLYLSSDLHDILPSATKLSPSYATALARAEDAAREDGEHECPGSRRFRRRPSLSRTWKRVSKRFPAELFRTV